MIYIFICVGNFDFWINTVFYLGVSILFCKFVRVGVFRLCRNFSRTYGRVRDLGFFRYRLKIWF